MAELTEKQRAALAKGRIQKGEVRNPKGINGVTKARAKVERLLLKNVDDLTQTLIELAKAGDLDALKFVLRGVVPEQPKQVQVESDNQVTVRWAEPGEVVE